MVKFSGLLGRERPLGAIMYYHSMLLFYLKLYKVIVIWTFFFLTFLSHFC